MCLDDKSQKIKVLKVVVFWRNFTSFTGSKNRSERIDYFCLWTYPIYLSSSLLEKF